MTTTRATAAAKTETATDNLQAVACLLQPLLDLMLLLASVP